MATKDQFKPRPRAPKGARPFALGDRHLERVLSMVVSVAAEVSVIHDRYDTLARILAEKGMLRQEDLENYEPDDEVERQREAWREAFLDRMLRILQEDIQEDSLQQREENYRKLQEKLARPQARDGLNRRILGEAQ